MLTFTERLKSLRGNRNTREFAELLGVSPGMISKYETGKSTPNSKKIDYFAKQLGVSVEWLLHGMDTQPKIPDVSCILGDKKAQHIEITNHEKNTMSDVGDFPSTLYGKINALHESNADLLREIADLRVEVANLKHENKDLNRQLAEALAAVSATQIPTQGTARVAQDAQGAAPASEGRDKPAPQTAMQDSVAAP